ncbi:uncharacterized protein BX663DRAFT_507430 [Cokeromyces recurvatus]|uniref:uncharacterized protein n=1 Tax=Cokeromyces recurvatus TaxID=90255 RepID=UPI0022206F73|nr:uncharacterized protein BX663DRAFT_507430 [Cokeromyces recurvatus]KAI7903742.1 hypothetical protein BX663DRAFT_507430 [Cokeromyces recurvatus]
MALGEKNEEIDIIDIQDKMGYVDTGFVEICPTIKQPQLVTSNTSYLNIKEPKPQRQVQINSDYYLKPYSNDYQALNNNNNNNNKSDSTDETLPSHSFNNDVVVSQQLQERLLESKPSNKGKGKGSSTKATSISPTYTPRLWPNQIGSSNVTESQQRLLSLSDPNSHSLEYENVDSNEVKDRVVSKLYEIADMLKSLNIVEKQQQQQQQQQRLKKRSSTASLSSHYNDAVSSPPLRPTPSKSSPYQYQQPSIQRKSSQNSSSSGSSNNNNNIKNKSNFDPTSENNNSKRKHHRDIMSTDHFQVDNPLSHYHETSPNNRHHSLYYPRPPYEPDYNHHFYYHPEDRYNYHTIAPPPPPLPHLHPDPHSSRFYHGSIKNGSSRQKSYNNDIRSANVNHEQHYYVPKPMLQRKGSRGNSRRPVMRQVPIYDDIIYDPQFHPPDRVNPHYYRYYKQPYSPIHYYPA